MTADPARAGKSFRYNQNNSFNHSAAISHDSNLRCASFPYNTFFLLAILYRSINPLCWLFYDSRVHVSEQFISY